MKPDIVNRAGNENGPVITYSKAATIVATGGTVVTCAVDPDGHNLWGMRARVSGGSAWRVQEPKVSWSSLAENTADQARAHAACVSQAANIADEVPNVTWRFDTVPEWVHTKLDETSTNWSPANVCQQAAHRYHAGDVSWNQTWEWVIAQANKGDDHDASH